MDPIMSVSSEPTITSMSPIPASPRLLDKGLDLFSTSTSSYFNEGKRPYLTQQFLCHTPAGAADPLFCLHVKDFRSIPAGPVMSIVTVSYNLWSIFHILPGRRRAQSAQAESDSSPVEAVEWVSGKRQ